MTRNSIVLSMPEDFQYPPGLITKSSKEFEGSLWNSLWLKKNYITYSIRENFIRFSQIIK